MRNPLDTRPMAAPWAFELLCGMRVDIAECDRWEERCSLRLTVTTQYTESRILGRRPIVVALANQPDLRRAAATNRRRVDFWRAVLGRGTIGLPRWAASRYD